jgi:hypothetical protein
LRAIVHSCKSCINYEEELLADKVEKGKGLRRKEEKAKKKRK